MIKDSGTRKEFVTGAVRDMPDGKGRCDLMPLGIFDGLLGEIGKFQETGDTSYLENAFDQFIEKHCVRFILPRQRLADMLLEVSKHFEEGALKYGENNWQKGIPAHCYVDSAVRHYLKYLRGDDDERHDRAFCWNLICCIWTCKHLPELNDYSKAANGND